MKKKILLFTLLFILIDQLSKLLIVNNFDLNNEVSIIPSFFSLMYIRNTGAAWGMFSNGTIILAIFSLAFLVFTLKYVFSKKRSNLEIIIISMLYGGIIGNLIDRLFRNYVVDFLSFKIFGYNFPVFNIADCYIVISIGLIIIKMIMDDRGKKNAS
jgi:signal peptidase II